MTTIDDDLDLATFRAAVNRFATGRSYRPTARAHPDDTPYHRPLDAQRLAGLDWAGRLAESELCSDQSLTANRLLANIYESGALFLPSQGLAGHEADFEAFYSSRSRLDGDLVSAQAEAYVFDFLDSSVRVNGRWDSDTLEAHFSSAIDEAVRADRPVLRAIESATDPARAAELMIVQMALDGLTEATAMSQNLGGAYGTEQSELFKIFIDEFGYGVFDTKHSTLFAQLCDSIVLNSQPHHYWFFYLPSWLAGNNYFYRVTRNRTGFFRYVGAMAYLEATFAPSFEAMTKTFRTVYGDLIDTRYCDEHAHIDQHHGRMAVHDLLLPLARKHGQRAIKDLVRGMEEVRLLGRLADEELLAQIQWQPTVTDGARGQGGAVVDLTNESPFNTGVANSDITISVLRGTAELHWLPTQAPLAIEAGECVLVPAGRLYGVRTPETASVRICLGERR